MLEMDEQDDCIIYTDDEIHFIEPNSRASRWVLMLDACEDLLPANRLAGFREACVCAVGREGEDYGAVKARLQHRKESQMEEVSKTGSYKSNQPWNLLSSCSLHVFVGYAGTRLRSFLTDYLLTSACMDHDNHICMYGPVCSRPALSS